MHACAVFAAAASVRPHVSSRELGVACAGQLQWLQHAVPQHRAQLVSGSNKKNKNRTFPMTTPCCLRPSYCLPQHTFWRMLASMLHVLICECAIAGADGLAGQGAGCGCHDRGQVQGTRATSLPWRCRSAAAGQAHASRPGQGCRRDTAISSIPVCLSSRICVVRPPRMKCTRAAPRSCTQELHMSHPAMRMLCHQSMPVDCCYGQSDL